jgi:hypothetical protein
LTAGAVLRCYLRHGKYAVRRRSYLDVACVGRQYDQALLNGALSQIFGIYRSHAELDISF